MQLVAKLMAALPIAILISFSVYVVNFQVSQLMEREAVASLASQIYSAIQNSSLSGVTVPVQYNLKTNVDLSCSHGILVVVGANVSYSIVLGEPCEPTVLQLDENGTLAVTVDEGVVHLR